MVIQAELNKLCRFHILQFISIRVLKIEELPLQAYRESGEIVFPTVMLKCGVRLPLAPFVRRLLSEFLLHFL